MRALRTALLAALALSLASCGPRPSAVGEPALWRIADEDSEIWLLGSVHVLPPDLVWRSEAINEAFAAADELVIETDTAAEGAAELGTRYGLLPPGQRLSELLSEDANIRLRRVCASLGVDPAALEPLRPWLAGLQLSFAFATSRGQQTSAGVEAVLTPEARAQGKRVSFLETPEQQIRTLADLSDADQIRFLETSLREIEEEPDTLDVIDHAWAQGDVEGLARLLQAQLNAAGAEPYAAIITRRNGAWAVEIERRLNGSGRIFYAVGAAHLVGEGGVVDLLRDRGIAVEGP